MRFAKKFGLYVDDIGSKQTLQAITDYPLTQDDLDFVKKEEIRWEKMSDDERSVECNKPDIPLNDRLKAVTVISYDRNKYCYIIYKNEIYNVKSGYLYIPDLIKIPYYDGSGYRYKNYSYKKLIQLPHLYFR